MSASENIGIGALGTISGLLLGIFASGTKFQKRLIIKMPNGSQTSIYGTELQKLLSGEVSSISSDGATFTTIP